MDDFDSSSQPFDAKAFLKGVTRRPGVYQMLDAEERLLYIGKASNLRARLASYFRNSQQPVKTQALVKRIARVEVTVTGSETEALLLEQNLIKRHRPPYNILLRDDKSYPYIHVSTKDQYPGLYFHRGARRRQGRYFGPFPSGGAVRESLNLLQKIFRIRQCEDSFFRNRSRPCLQYQINRCSGPCVGLIAPEDYALDVRHALQFLEGRNQSISQELAERMEAAAANLEFEQAARFRDQITSLQKVQEQQRISGEGGELDVLACVLRAGRACVHQLFIKGGRVVGSKAHFPRLSLETSEAELLTQFIGQSYLAGESGGSLPPEILSSHEPEDATALSEALSDAAGRRVELSWRLRGQRRQWLELASQNADNQLDSLIASRKSLERRFLELQEALDLERLPLRLECFDISHSAGEATVASCVVFDHQGPRKSDYRRFNIENITPGDDYAAMHQALERRYRRLKREEAVLPDLLIIDGGKGQVTQAEAVLEALELSQVDILGIAKGPERKPGLEVLIHGGRELTLGAHNGALHLLQHIRDEAHRFALAGHRARRGKSRGQSGLESIPGVGPRRRQALLRHFGSLQGVRHASIEEIAKVSTISRAMAEHIHAFLHPD